MNPASSTASAGYSFGALALSVLFSLGAFTSVHAAVLVDDQFNDNDFSDGADTLDAAWTAPVNAALSIVPFNSTGNTSAAVYINSSATNALTRGAFTNTTALAIGESITLSFDFRMIAAATNDTAGLRFGLGTSSNTFGFTFGTGTSSAVGTAQFATGTVSGPNTPYTSTGATFSINNTASHSFSFTITRTSGTSLSFLSSVDANTVSAVSNNTISNFTFNSIILGQGSSSANDINIDNVIVSVIPEPSTYAALAGLAVLGLVVCKRSRKSF
jgi:hypothetical protein